METGSVITSRRDTGEKKSFKIALAADILADLMDEIQSNMIHGFQ
jgi:hypothetical protein